MNTTEGYFLSILGCLIREEAMASPPEQADWDALYALAKRHSLAGSLYSVLTGLPQLSPAQLEPFQSAYHEELYKDTMYQVELDSLDAAFSSGQVPYAPFKGALLRGLYPSTLIRTMSDLDILLQPDGMEAAQPALEAAGYHYVNHVSVHSVYFKAPCTTLEVHSAVLSNWSDYSAYFAHIWPRLSPTPGHPFRYEMPMDLIYLITLTHFEKHLTNAGANVRQVLDLYLLSERYGLNSGKASIAQALASLGLTAFTKNMEALARAWFAKEPPPLPEKLSRLGETILAGGTGEYAIHHAYQSRYVKQWSGVTKLHRRLFPSLSSLARHYPTLRDKPWLYLPYWVLNLFRGAKYEISRPWAALARLWLRLTGQSDWIDLYRQAHQRELF